MTRLRTVSPHDSGWTRRRAGRGFVYLDAAGDRVPREQAERIRALVIPPAWQDVWICPAPNGHLQAVGTDAAGRRQYLYHPDWRAARDADKFERVAALARRLPQARTQVRKDLQGPGMPLRRACATAVRLLDLGYFRIGGDSSGAEESYGLTTLERSHVTRSGSTMVFAFTGKSGVAQRVEISDRAVRNALGEMRRRRGGTQLLAYRGEDRWRELDAGHVNAYLSEQLELEMTAKDFRTWHATVLAAVALASSDRPAGTKAARKRAISTAMREVSEFLGNTPTVARSSYVDPRVVDLYEDGVTIAAAVRRRHASAEQRQQALERAVLRLLGRGRSTR